MTASVSNSRIALSEEARILTLCARPEMDSSTGAILRELLGNRPDTDRLATGMVSNFVTHLVRKHVRNHARDTVDPDFLRSIDEHSKLFALRQMEVLRLLVELERGVLSTVPHVVVKGPVLSLAIYGDAFTRQYRDIDVLLAGKSIEKVGKDLVNAGYTIQNKLWTRLTARDFGALCRYNAALELKSPSGVVVELHHRLDNTGLVFDTAKILTSRRTVNWSGLQLPILDDAYLAAHALFHHSRHRWSSLHWIADLFALHNGLLQMEAHAQAAIKRTGLKATLEEAIVLRDDLDMIARNGCLNREGSYSRFLLDALEAIEDSFNPARLINPDAVTNIKEPDFPYWWQKHPKYRIMFQLGRIRPSIDDYEWWPLPANWRWLYFLVRPLRIATARLFAAKR